MQGVGSSNLPFPTILYSRTYDFLVVSLFSSHAHLRGSIPTYAHLKPEDISREFEKMKGEELGHKPHMCRSMAILLEGIPWNADITLSAPNYLLTFALLDPQAERMHLDCLRPIQTHEG
jgi:hypothetical protein